MRYALVSLLLACSPVEPEMCRFRVAVLPGETEVEAIHRTVPDLLRRKCGADIIYNFVYVMGDT